MVNNQKPEFTEISNELAGIRDDLAQIKEEFNHIKINNSQSKKRTEKYLPKNDSQDFCPSQIDLFSDSIPCADEQSEFALDNSLQISTIYEISQPPLIIEQCPLEPIQIFSDLQIPVLDLTESFRDKPSDIKNKTKIDQNNQINTENAYIPEKQDFPKNIQEKTIVEEIKLQEQLQNDITLSELPTQQIIEEITAENFKSESPDVDTTPEKEVVQKIDEVTAIAVEEIQQNTAPTTLQYFNNKMKEKSAQQLLDSLKEPDKPIIQHNSLFYPNHLQTEIKNILIFMDKLLENLPEKKVQEFMKSKHFDTYRSLFEELELL